MAGEREYEEAIGLTPESAPLTTRLLRAEECLQRQFDLWDAMNDCAKTYEALLITHGRRAGARAALRRVQEQIRLNAQVLFNAPVRQGHHLDDDKAKRREE